MPRPREVTTVIRLSIARMCGHTLASFNPETPAPNTLSMAHQIVEDLRAEGYSFSVKIKGECNTCDRWWDEHDPDCPKAMTCEYPVWGSSPSGAKVLVECGEPGHAVVGTDFTPYCSKHWQEMQRREEAST